MEKNDRIVPASSVPMYQVHGNHVDIVMDTDRFFNDYLNTVIHESSRVKGAETEVQIDENRREVTGVAAVEYGDEDFGIQSFLAVNKPDGRLMFMGSFPYCYGKKIKVLIKKVWVWDTLLEAAIDCSVNGWGFTFFATDYFAHKDDYIPGKEVEVRIGALGMKVKEGMRGFSFEGQQAVDWLAKLGRKPSYDEKGEVKPVNFSMEKLVAFYSTEQKCPDEVTFQSPAGEIRERSLLGIDFFETEILIFNYEFELSIPLIFRKDMLPNAKKDMPLSGWAWVTGAI